MNSTIRTGEVERITSVTLKAAMAVTGLALAAWLTLHMAGVLTVFGGRELMNGYAQKFRDTGLLWPMRVALVVLLSIHVACAVLTSLQAHRARPRSYAVGRRMRNTTLAARSMRLTGFVLLGFIGLHVSQIYGVGRAGYVPGNVHHNLLGILREPLSAAVYLGATTLVTLHLAHGLGSSLISLGFVARRRARLLKRGLAAWASIVMCGFAIEILAGFFGVVGHG